MADGGPLSGLKLSRASAAGQIASALRRRILEGELAPGTPLTESWLAEAFGVSRNTVREGLALLVRDGIVTQSPHRGVSVTRLDASDVQDIYGVRRLLELSAVSAGRRLPDERLAALRKCVDELSGLDRSADWREIVDADLAFHEELIKLLGSARLERLYQQLLTELRLCILIANVEDHESAESLARQHADLLELLESGSIRECKTALSGHLHRGESLLLHHFGQEL